MEYRMRWGRKLKRKIILPKFKAEGDDISLSGPLLVNQIEEAFAGKSFSNVDIRDTNFIDLKAAEAICRAKSIRSLAIWSRISRAAFSCLVNAEGLHESLVSKFAGCGRLRNFNSARDLETFRAFYTLSSADLIEIANLPKLNSLTAHAAEFGTKALARLAEMSTLRSVDFEAVTITDDMAKALAKSRSITDVVVPATCLTRGGLGYFSEMPQLRYIDIWANGLRADALDLFDGHPSLEILELGSMGYDANRVLNARDIIPKLEKMPKLNTVYFENVATTAEEEAFLGSRYKFRLVQEQH
jgi:hypothetical protein